MHFNLFVIKILLICLTCCLIAFLLLGLLPVSIDQCNCYERDFSFSNKAQLQQSNHWIKSTSNGYKLAVLVPFRDRFNELLQFVPHITKFLTLQHISHHIFILNQIDNYRFNRASLINVGFLYTNDFDYIVMHDIDLLPQNNNLKYSYPNDGPIHISSPDYHPKYHYKNFVGGILLIKREHFQLMNGMSNKYWGWGLEDDEFYLRIKEAGFTVFRLQNITTGRENTFLHNHEPKNRKRDTIKCFNQKEETRKRDRQTGLNNIKYNITEIKKLTIDKIPLTVLNIKLECDKGFTPWCDCNSPPS